MTDPVPGDVYDAALRLVSGGSDPHDLAAVDGWFVRNVNVTVILRPPIYNAEAREILRLAAERGVARVCRG